MQGLFLWVEGVGSLSVCSVVVYHGVIKPWRIVQNTQNRLEFMLQVVRFQTRLSCQLRSAEKMEGLSASGEWRVVRAPGIREPIVEHEEAPFEGALMLLKSKGSWHWIGYRVHKGRLKVHVSTDRSLKHWEILFNPTTTKITAFSLAMLPSRSGTLGIKCHFQADLKGAFNESLSLDWIVPLKKLECYRKQ